MPPPAARTRRNAVRYRRVPVPARILTRRLTRHGRTQDRPAHTGSRRRWTAQAASRQPRRSARTRGNDGRGAGSGRRRCRLARSGSPRHSHLGHQGSMALHRPRCVAQRPLRRQRQDRTVHRRRQHTPVARQRSVQAHHRRPGRRGADRRRGGNLEPAASASPQRAHPVHRSARRHPGRRARRGRRHEQQGRARTRPVDAHQPVPGLRVGVPGFEGRDDGPTPRSPRHYVGEVQPGCGGESLRLGPHTHDSRRDPRPQPRQPAGGIPLHQGHELQLGPGPRRSTHPVLSRSGHRCRRATRPLGVPAFGHRRPRHRLRLQPGRPAQLARHPRGRPPGDGAGRREHR